MPENNRSVGVSFREPSPASGTTCARKRRARPPVDVTNGGDARMEAAHASADCTLAQLQEENQRLNARVEELEAAVTRLTQHIESVRRRFVRVRMDGLTDEIRDIADAMAFKFTSVRDVEAMDANAELDRYRDACENNDQWPAASTFLDVLERLTGNSMLVLRVFETILHSAKSTFTSRAGWLDALSMWHKTRSAYAVESINHHAAPRYDRLLRALRRVVTQKKASVADKDSFRVDERGIVQTRRPTFENRERERQCKQLEEGERSA